MDLSKHLDFFDPINTFQGALHIIGCGAIGGTLAEMLVRMGIPELTIYDMDVVDPHNVANQVYDSLHIGLPKTTALEHILLRINPELKLNIKGEYKQQPLSGYVFLAVDNIDLRRQIVEQNLYNNSIKAVFDFRMRLTDAQHYAADWAEPKNRNNLLDTMQFSHDEAKEATPVNACGTTLNVVSTVRVIVSVGLANFINFVKSQGLKKLIIIDSYAFDILAM